MKISNIKYIVGVSCLLLLGVGCSFSFTTKPEEKVPPVANIVDQEQLETDCTDLGGTPSRKLSIEGGREEVFCGFGETGECTQRELEEHICFAQLKEKQFDPDKSLIIENGAIRNFDQVRGNIEGDKVNIILDDTLVASFHTNSSSVAGNLALWNGGSAEDNPIATDYDYFFEWRNIEVSTQLNAAYGMGTEKIKKGVAYKCDGPFLTGSPYFYCETDGKTYLTQYEFNSARDFGVATGGDYPEGWKKISVRKIGDKDVFFILPLEAGEIRLSDDPKDKKSETGLELTSKAYLDSVLASKNIPMLGSQKKYIDEFDAFVTSTKFRLKGYQDHVAYTLPSDFTSSSEVGMLAFQAQKEVPGHYGRIEVFSMPDFGDRPFGFEDGNMSEEDQIHYIPREQKEVQIDGATFDVWLWYKKDDTQTKKELDSIVQSLKLK